MANGIRSAQEAYRAETLTYLNVSEDLSNYYPVTEPGRQKVQWGGGETPLANRWRVLAVTTDGAVYYGYSVIAGPPGEVVAPNFEFGSLVSLPVAVEPWYIVQAKGDINGNSIPSFYFASSFSNAGV